MDIFRVFLAIVYVIACILLVIVVLLQKSKGGGLASAFGGAGSESAFGVQTADSLSKFTRILAVSFFVLALVLTLIRPKSLIDSGPTQQPGMPVPISETLEQGAPADQTMEQPAVPVAEENADKRKDVGPPP